MLEHERIGGKIMKWRSFLFPCTIAKSRIFGFDL